MPILDIASYERAITDTARAIARRGHIALRQGAAFECPRCGRTCTVPRTGGAAVGSLATERCDG